MQVETKTVNGAKLILKTLGETLGVDTIFGYPGGIVLNVYDEIYKQSLIKHILSRHEQASVHAAEGYARVSGKCGVVLVTSGPGATNIVTGLANAYLDGYPLIAITGQVYRELIGKDAFQEIDIVDIVKPCTKFAVQVQQAEELEETLIKAYEIAMSGKKGPVLVDIARNVFSESVEFKGLKPRIEKPEKTAYLEDFLRLLNSSKSPVIVAGGGVKHSGASELLRRFSEKFQIPVVSTLMGLGTFPQENPLYCGMLGIFGTKSAYEIIKHSDLIISLGARFNDRIRSCDKSGELDNKIVQVDINKSELSRVIDAKMNIHADIKEFLNEILECRIKNYSEWANCAEHFSAQNPKHVKISEKLHSFEVMNAIYEFTKNKHLPVATEVGQHQMWCAKEYKFTYPEQFLTSGGSGTMGFGLPAAIGASIANKGQEVICITGDGSFQMNFQELATIVQYGLPVKIFVFNNNYLGMVRQLQEKYCAGRYCETEIINPDFIKIAQSYGIDAVRVCKQDEITPALTKAFDAKKPFIIDFIIEPMETV